MKVSAYYEFHGELDVDIPNGESMTKDEIEDYLYDCLPTGSENATVYNAVRIFEDGQEEVIFEY